MRTLRETDIEGEVPPNLPGEETELGDISEDE
jgi:hypothetical protein